MYVDWLSWLKLPLLLSIHSFISVDNPMKVECATSASLCMTCNLYLLVGLHFRLITKQKRSSSFVVLFRPFLFPLSLFFTVWFDLFSYSVARIPLENKRFVASATAWLPFDSYDFFFLLKITKCVIFGIYQQHIVFWQLSMHVAFYLSFEFLLTCFYFPPYFPFIFCCLYIFFLVAQENWRAGGKRKSSETWSSHI